MKACKALGLLLGFREFLHLLSQSLRLLSQFRKPGVSALLQFGEARVGALLELSYLDERRFRFRAHPHALLNKLGDTGQTDFGLSLAVENEFNGAFNIHGGRIPFGVKSGHSIRPIDVDGSRLATPVCGLPEPLSSSC